MIKLIECKNTNTKNIQILKTDDIFEFVLSNHAIMATHKLNIELLNDLESVSIRYSNTYKRFIQYTHNFNSRDIKTFYENYYDLDKSISIIVAKQSSEVVIIVYGNIDENLTDLPIMSETGNWLDILQKHLPAYAEAYRKKKDAKVDLMRCVSPLDSISYLEKQVDILSALVLSLIQDKEPEWLPTFQTVLAETSSVSEQNVGEMIEKLYIEKSGIRDLQSKYFNAIKDETP